MVNKVTREVFEASVQMTTQELTAHIKQLNEYPQELLKNRPEDLLELENALYDLAEHLEEVRLGMISYEDKP